MKYVIFILKVILITILIPFAVIPGIIIMGLILLDNFENKPTHIMKHATIISPKE